MKKCIWIIETRKVDVILESRRATPCYMLYGSVTPNTRLDRLEVSDSSALLFYLACKLFFDKIRLYHESVIQPKSLGRPDSVVVNDIKNSISPGASLGT